MAKVQPVGQPGLDGGLEMVLDGKVWKLVQALGCTAS